MEVIVFGLSFFIFIFILFEELCVVVFCMLVVCLDLELGEFGGCWFFVVFCVVDFYVVFCELEFIFGVEFVEVVFVELLFEILV